MKIKKNIFLLGILFLLFSNTVIAQRDHIIRAGEEAGGEYLGGNSGGLILDDLNQAKSVNSNTEDLNLNWGNNPLGVAFQNALNFELANNIMLDVWLGRQENKIREYLQDYLGKSFPHFSDAKQAFFERIENRNIEWNKKFAKQPLQDTKNIYDERTKFNLNQLNLLLIRKTEIESGNINNSQFGNTEVEGIKLRDIKDLNLINQKWSIVYDNFSHNHN